MKICISYTKTLFVFFLTSLLWLSSFSPVMASTRDAFYEASGDIVILANRASNGTDSSNRANEIVFKKKELEPEHIQQLAANYLKKNLSPSILEHVKIHTPTQFWDWPISKNTMVIKIRYPGDYLQINDDSYPIVSFTAQLMYPQFEDPSHSIIRYSIADYLLPTTSMYINLNDAQFSKELDRVMGTILSSIAANLYASEAHKNNSKNLKE